MSKGTIIVILIILAVSVIIAAVLTMQLPQAGEDSGLTPTTIPTKQANGPTPTPAQRTIKVFMIDLEDGGESGELIGCNDSVVPLEAQISTGEPELHAALDALLSVDRRIVVDDGLYNSLYQSELSVVSAIIEADGTAIIRLTGALMLGGVCDNPRVEAQITQTALQFPEVEDTKIFINDRPLEEVLSGQ